MGPQRYRLAAAPLWTTCAVVLILVAILVPLNEANDGNKAPNCRKYPYAPLCRGAPSKRLPPSPPITFRTEPDTTDFRPSLQFNGPPEYIEYGQHEDDCLRDLLKKYWHHQAWSEE